MEDIDRLIALPRLDQDFYCRDAMVVALDLIGKILIHRTNNNTIHAARICETEAYLQHGDEASHSRRGKTRRNQSMFEACGTCYIYLIYGLHYCLNVSTGPKDQGDAVLFRWAIPLTGQKTSFEQRIKLLKGPGKIAKEMGFSREDNGLNFCGDKFWIADDGFRFAPQEVQLTPRIGISKGADLNYRCVANNESIKKLMTQ